MSHSNFISAKLLHSLEILLVGTELSQTIFVLFLVFEILSLLTGYWCSCWRAEGSAPAQEPDNEIGSEGE